MELNAFLTFNLGILVYFLGERLSNKFKVLRSFNIPDPVSGGLLAALLVFGLTLVIGVQLEFDLGARDFLLLYFFTSIGLNSRFSDLLKGGVPLLLLLVLTISYMLVQNMVGIAAAYSLGFPEQVGVLTGTVSLVGGHGTAIAWSPTIASEYGISNAAEIGIASATLGLILASLIGGPIAKYLIDVRGAKPGAITDIPSEAIAYDNKSEPNIDHRNLMRAIFVLNLTIALGYGLNTAISEAGVKLPLFVPCLICGILISNTLPKAIPAMRWPAHTPALAVISEFSLGVFLSMSLMSLNLASLADLAGSLLVILTLQAIVAIAFIIFILFRVMGRDYDAAVLSAGFGGFALGATPTAIANMSAVTKTHGAAAQAMIILPLVSAFFVDLVNAMIIPMFLNGGW